MDRKGLFTPQQERILDDMIRLPAPWEMFDGIAIRLCDNLLAEVIIKRLSAEKRQLLHEVIDEVFNEINGGL